MDSDLFTIITNLPLQLTIKRNNTKGSRSRKIRDSRILQWNSYDYDIHYTVRNMALNGPCEIYCKNDKYDDIYVKCTFSDGRLDGKFIRRSKRQIFIECYYIEGQLDGPYVEFYRAGKRRIECYYEQGKLSGSYSKFYASGLLNISCSRYTEGKKDGIYIEFDTLGDKISEISYQNDYKQGIAKNYHPLCKTMSEETYDCDQLIKVETFPYTDSVFDLIGCEHK